METIDRKQVVLGIDFGATNLKALLVDSEGKEYQRFKEDSKPEDGPDETLNRIVELVKRAKKKANSAGLQLTGIGIGVCGPVNHSKGEIVESPILPGWRNVPVKEVIEKEAHLPVQIDNDANLAVLGEWWKGAGDRRAVVAGLTLGTGVGGGLVINGRIYRGGMGFGAEFGHISVAPDPPCPCRGRGCLGRVASATATLRWYNDKYKELAGKEAAPVIDIRKLAERAEKGDDLARESIEVSANYLAKGILTIINFLNPNIFVLAGGMALLKDDLLLNRIREFVRSSTFEMIGENTPIVSAELGIHSGCYGSAKLALSGAQALPE